MAQKLPRRIVQEDELWNIGRVDPVLDTAIDVLDDVYMVKTDTIDTDGLKSFTADTQDNLFVGIAKGGSLYGVKIPISVARVCIIETGLTSASGYVVGLGLKWASKHIYVDAADAKTIAWCGFEGDGATAVTYGLAEINVIILAMVAADAKLYQTAAA